MLEAFADVFVEATQPRSADTAVDAMESSGMLWIDKLATRLGHGRSLGLRALRVNQNGRSFGSDLSEGWVYIRIDHKLGFKWLPVPRNTIPAAYPPPAIASSNGTDEMAIRHVELRIT